jgi:hypothetical protein
MNLLATQALARPERQTMALNVVEHEHEMLMLRAACVAKIRADFAKVCVVQGQVVPLIHSMDVDSVAAFGNAEQFERNISNMSLDELRYIYGLLNEKRIPKPKSLGGPTPDPYRKK